MLNLVVPVLRDRPFVVYIIVCMMVEQFVLTVINEDYYFYYYNIYEISIIMTCVVCQCNGSNTALI